MRRYEEDGRQKGYNHFDTQKFEDGSVWMKELLGGLFEEDDDVEGDAHAHVVDE